MRVVDIAEERESKEARAKFVVHIHTTYIQQNTFITRPERVIG